MDRREALAKAAGVDATAHENLDLSSKGDRDLLKQLIESALQKVGSCVGMYYGLNASYCVRSFDLSVCLTSLAVHAFIQLSRPIE